MVEGCPGASSCLTLAGRLRERSSSFLENLAGSVYCPDQACFQKLGKDVRTAKQQLSTGMHRWKLEGFLHYPGPSSVEEDFAELVLPMSQLRCTSVLPIVICKRRVN